MSIATALNLTIAMVEQKPAKVRNIARGLALAETRELLGATARLESAIEVREQQAVYNALQGLQELSMIVDTDPTWSPERVQAFLEGINFFEQAIDFQLNDLRRNLGLDEEKE